MRLRWLIVLALLPVYAAALIVLALIVLVAIVSDGFEHWWSGVGEALLDPYWWTRALPTGLAVAGTQALLLLPVFRFQAMRSARRKSMALSAIMLALLAAALTVGLLSGLAELLPETMTSRWLVDERPQAVPIDVMDRDWFPAFFWATLIGSWIIWSAILIPFTQRRIDRDGRMGRLIGWLLGGTLIEVIVIMPIDVMVRRRTDCYCATGTFITLMLASSAALWLTGPGILIAITAKRRRAWRLARCANCGYAHGPSPGERCPECGDTWR